MTPAEVSTDRTPTYPRVLDGMWPMAWHHVARYANNWVEADHAQLKRRLRPMRGIKTMTGLRILVAGHALVQNLRRGHYEIATDQSRMFDSPSRSANWPRQSDRQGERPTSSPRHRIEQRNRAGWRTLAIWAGCLAFLPRIR
jgi:DDE domain